MKNLKILVSQHLKYILKRKNLPGFTLIELSIVMIIVGIIMAGVFKGQDLIESARLQSTISEMNRIKLATLQYREHFGAWPGNDKAASDRFGEGTQSGNGKGIILSEETEHVWKHLSAAGLMDNQTAPIAKVGGFFSVLGNPTQTQKGNWVILSGKAGTLKPVLTPKQAMILKSKMDESDPTKGSIRVINGLGTEANGCINGSTYNLKNENPVCVVMMKLD